MLKLKVNLDKVLSIVKNHNSRSDQKLGSRIFVGGLLMIFGRNGGVGGLHGLERRNYFFFFHCGQLFAQLDMSLTLLQRGLELGVGEVVGVFFC